MWRYLRQSAQATSQLVALCQRKMQPVQLCTESRKKLDTN